MLPHVSGAREGGDAGQYTAVYAHMDHASSMNADIAGRAKHGSVKYRWKCSFVEMAPVK